MHWNENVVMVKISNSTIAQSFIGSEHNPVGATFTINIVLQLNGVIYEKQNNTIN